MPEQLYGPNTQLIDDFKRKLESFPWFTQIDKPHPQDGSLARVRLDFILNNPADPWDGVDRVAENQIDRHIIDSSRLAEQYSLQTTFRAPWNTQQVEPVLDALLDRYRGNYPGTYSYAHELLEFPERVVRYAYFECLVDDLVPRVTFFRDLMPWFEQGHWPCGWRGKFPEGQLILL